MDMIIKGGQVPNGKVKVSGAKNSATRLLAASLLTDETVRLQNFPTELVDARAKIEFIKQMGAEINVNRADNLVTVDAKNLSLGKVVNYDLGIRTTYLLAAAQLVRNTTARVPYPGGCKIGSRGYDLHMMVWERMGCRVEECQDFISIEGELIGTEIDFPISTVGGTENALLCGAVAKGQTIIKNAYVTPEVQDLISCLKLMGAKIQNVGNSMLVVDGTGGLLQGVTYSVMNDRIEALTWIIYAAISGGTVQVDGVPFDTMVVPLLHLKEAGIDFYQSSNSILVNPSCISKVGIQPFELACGTHPGVISDMQSFFVLLALFANGKSRVFDYRYPERIAFAEELERFAKGAITAQSGKITITGKAILKGVEVQSTDLRGSMVQVLAGLCASGTTTVKNVEMALRGYNQLTDKLSSLGVHVEEVA